MIPSNIVFHDSYKERLETILDQFNKNIAPLSKNYILFLNCSSQELISDNEFWTDYVNKTYDVKEHTMGAVLQNISNKIF